MTHRAGQRSRDAGAEPQVPPRGQRHRRAEFSRPAHPARPAQPAVSGRHRHRHAALRRRQAARPPAIPSRPSCGCWRCTACCICSDTITSATTGGWQRSSAAPPQGRAARGLIDAVADDSADRSFCSACAAVYLGAIEAAFSALMRLSLRLARRAQRRPDALGDVSSTIRSCCSSRSACCSASVDGGCHGAARRRDRHRRRAQADAHRARASLGSWSSASCSAAC